MNTPNYIVLIGALAAVDLRAYYHSNFDNDENYRGWVTRRFDELDMREWEAYRTLKDGPAKRHITTLPALKEMLLVGRGDATRDQRNAVKIVASQLLEAGFLVPDSIRDFPESAFQPVAFGPLSEEQMLTVEVDQTEEGAFVDGFALYRRFVKQGGTEFNEWMRGRIEKNELAEGVNFIRFENGIPDRFVKTRGYRLTLDAAITVARNEAKSKGHTIANFLSGFRNALTAQSSTAKNDQADTVDSDPENVRKVELEPADAVNDQPADEGHLQRALFANPVPVDSVTPLPVSEGKEPQAVEQAPNPGFESEDTPQVESDADRKYYEPEEPEPAEENPNAVPTTGQMLLQSAQLLLQLAHVVVDQERKLSETRQVVGQIVSIEQQSAQQTLGLFAGNVEPPQQTLRSRIRQAVNDRCRKTGETQDQVYAFIYNRLYYVFGINVNARDRGKDETYLMLCERIGVLDRVYTIVTSEEFQVAIRNAPVQPKAAA
ncbi:antA/AntB antirepressor family protein [Larkinella terrae]|uniref:Uncharacterized protein n=1 Tax=Larkinella terrae TaxID=2025311 RepID=A0A7K0EIH2_9BACT|nr:antA/AntB antirepressor family protein [Larkinella terrae]MRS61639.1 hypothetical protein [Larkinella terrae]